MTESGFERTDSGPAVQPVDRQQQLNDYFLDIASGGSLDPETIQYMQSGGSLRLCLREIEQLAEQSPEEQELEQSRGEYVEFLLQHRLPGRGPTRQRRQDLREAYVDNVISKVERVLEAKTPEDSLALRQMPTLISNTSFDEGRELSMEHLSANHLYLLADTALQEHIARRQLIDGHQGRLASAVGNRAARLAIAGSVFTATLVPELHVIPVANPGVADSINTSLEILAAGLFGWEAPEEVRWQYLDFAHGKQSRNLREQLAEDGQTADLALRLAYSSTRYGNSPITGVVTGRNGSEDKDENLQRFEDLDRQFIHLNNDPGGKPYTGDQALGYAARLLIEKRNQVKAILASSDQSNLQEELYIQLGRDILAEDVLRMEKGLSASPIRQSLIRAAGILPALLFPSLIAATARGSLHGKALANDVAPRKDKKNKKE
ncbi:MAG TPA: hypothetical protein VFW77_01260 [Candidatus Saccharimonadales bacterium]|nr:hypothetical protein [Candidatus Saccharimonadales bacterium]